MLRFSNGLKIHGGTGMDGKGFFVFEGSNLSIETHNKDWHLEIGNNPQRIWWRNTPGELLTFNKPLNDKVFAQLSIDLENICPDLLPHPCLSNQFFEEAKRIFPDLNEKSNLLFKTFIKFLNDEFDLFATLNAPSNHTAYSEDLGPFMIGTIDDNYILPPEIPILYHAPKVWSRLTWFINNHFSGPYPNNSELYNKLNGRRFDWGHLKIDNDLKNKKIEGLVYFFIAKFIIVHEAWAQNKAPESLNMLIELIQKNGERPWQYLY